MREDLLTRLDGDYVPSPEPQPVAEVVGPQEPPPVVLRDAAEVPLCGHGPGGRAPVGCWACGIAN